MTLKIERPRLALVLCFLIALPLFVALWHPDSVQSSDQVVIKLGTLAPEGSPWYNSLRAMGEKWSTASGGRVKLKIFAGGVSGNEGGIVRKVRINQLQAGCITTTGLIDIERSALSLQVPMTISSYEELDYIRDKMAPLFSRRLEEKGFKILNWGDAGWVYFFTRNLVTSPAQLKQVKLWSWEGDPPATTAFRQVGLKPVTLSANDVLPALQTGMVDGFPQTALAALSLQWFGGVKNMVNVKWAPMVGATVISMKGWNAIPKDLQPQILRISEAEGLKLQKEIRKLDNDAITQMKKYGLNVVEPSNPAEWQAFAEAFYASMRGTVMVADTMDQVIALHKEYKTRHP